MRKSVGWAEAHPNTDSALRSKGNRPSQRVHVLRLCSMVTVGVKYYHFDFLYES